MIYFLRSQQARHPTLPYLLAHVSIIIIILTAAPALRSDVYRIKKGDTLLIAVVGQPEYTHSVQVREDGRISYFGGDLEVAGETPTAVNQQIREFLDAAELVRNPVVMVSPLLQENGVFVGGAVKLPGRYPISPEAEIGLYRAIALAGGMTENADPQEVHRIPAAQPQHVETYDLSPTQPYRDIRVNVNDLVFVMPLSVIEVQGQVQTPGKLFVRGEINVAEALARAGGPTEEADLSQLLKIEQAGKLSEFSRDETFWKSAPAATPDLSLANGDVLYVPNVFKTEPIYVIGYVRVPGPQRVRGPLNVAQAITLSGGFEASANRDAVIVYRADGTQLEVPFTRTPNDETAQRVLLYPGDTLEVTEKFQINWAIVSTLASVTLSSVSLILSLMN